jgi:hypothetical protein
MRVIKADVKRYIESRLQLIALKVVENVSKYPVETVFKIAGGIFLLGTFAFLSVALALFVSGLLNNNLILGFVVASGPWLIGSLLLLLVKPSILERKIQDIMIEKFVERLRFDKASAEEDLLDNQKQTKQENS